MPMSTFYLNVDSTGVDKLLMESGETSVIWSFQTGSVEGPGGTYTLTPVFDTTMITLPSDVQVWYSNDGTNFAYSPAWITNRTGDTITVTVASSTTVTAKLYYTSGTVVTDENGAEVASVSTVIGGTPTTDYTDYFIAGSSYWIIPDGTITAQIALAGGDASAVWTLMRHEAKAGATTTVQGGASVTMDSEYSRVIQGGFNQLTNPYNYCAAWYDGAGGAFAEVEAPGWIVYEREATAESLTGSRQSFLPIEVQSGTVGGTTTSSGFGPIWSTTGNSDCLVFFFNSYTPGDVQDWSAWDGVTVP